MRETRNISKHASKQMQRRGIKQNEQNLFVKFADIETYVGEGCYRLECSETILKGLEMDGQICPQLREKYKKMYVIEEADTCITVAHRHGSRKKRYKQFLNGRVYVTHKSKRGSEG